MEFSEAKGEYIRRVASGVPTARLSFRTLRPQCIRIFGYYVVEAFPWDTAPKYLLRDRDGKYGEDFVRRVESLGIRHVLISARSPWQNAYVERIIGSIRRECLDHVIIFNERHLRRVLREYLKYYHGSRTHLGLAKDCPRPRPVEPSDLGPIHSESMIGGLHHRYFRQAA